MTCKECGGKGYVELFSSSVACSACSSAAATGDDIDDVIGGDIDVFLGIAKEKRESEWPHGPDETPTNAVPQHLWGVVLANPEGCVAAEPGTIYSTPEGGQFLKTSGHGNTGWKKL